MLINEIDRFGSAEFSNAHNIQSAGLFTQIADSLFVGFYGNRPLWYSGAGGVLLTAGARGGKLATVLGYNLCHGIGSAYSTVNLDMKGELAPISQNQTPDGKHCIYWNPMGLHGLPQHSINPLDGMRGEDPALVSKVKMFCENIIQASGSANSKYFEDRAREFVEGITVTLARLDGVPTYPRLYGIINLIPGNSDAWLDFAYEMHISGYPLSVRIEEEIAAARQGDGNAGGFQGILGEVFRAFSALSDPLLMASVSPPYDFSFEQLCQSGQLYQVNLMPPAEFISSWAPVIKSMFVAGMVYKAERPDAPRQTWILDECAQLGGFPLITKLFTYGAGIGIRPVAVFQSKKQMRAIGQDAESIIASSAALRMYFAIRDIESATDVSRMLGAQTLEYDDEEKQAAARLAKQQAMNALLMGEDPFRAGADYRHHRDMSEHRSKMHRLLRTPDEVLNMPPNKMYLFADGLASPIYADRKPYWEQKFMAGRFHPNPYHPPAGKVRVKTTFGHAWRRVITEPVPARFAHYPQYQEGHWSRIDP
ncbi:MAG: type IV secretory system conjugative DNA transfer family protein [Pseudomonadota bacterium]